MVLKRKQVVFFFHLISPFGSSRKVIIITRPAGGALASGLYTVLKKLIRFISWISGGEGQRVCDVAWLKGSRFVFGRCTRTVFELPPHRETRPRVSPPTVFFPSPSRLLRSLPSFLRASAVVATTKISQSMIYLFVYRRYSTVRSALDAVPGHVFRRRKHGKTFPCFRHYLVWPWWEVTVRMVFTKKKKKKQQIKFRTSSCPRFSGLLSFDFIVTDNCN